MRTQIPSFVFASPNAEAENGYDIKLFSEDQKWYANADDIKLNEEAILIPLELPDFAEQELLQKAIATLKELQERKLAEAEVARLNIQKKIDKLLMLTHQPNLKVI